MGGTDRFIESEQGLPREAVVDQEDAVGAFVERDADIAQGMVGAVAVDDGQQDGMTVAEMCSERAHGNLQRESRRRCGLAQGWSSRVADKLGRARYVGREETKCFATHDEKCSVSSIRCLKHVLRRKMKTSEKRGACVGWNKRPAEAGPYRIVRISYQTFPRSVSIATTWPALWRRSADPRGDWNEIRPSVGDASVGPTMR